jgi:hypothetical protein
MAASHGSIFGDHLFAKNIWPSYSPDLTLPDFFLWGHFKERAFKDHSHMLNDLKKAISQAINNITPAMLRRASWNCDCKRTVDTSNTCYKLHHYTICM